MTIDKLFSDYIELKSSSISKQTYRTNLGFYNNHIAPIFGHRDIATVHYIDYQKFANNLLLKLKPKTVKNILLVLTSICKYAKKIEVYHGDNIISYVDLPRFDNRRYFTLSVDEQVAYIKAIMGFQEPIYKDIFLFLLHGRRVSEVLDLKWERLDMVQGVLYLPSTHNKSKKNLSFKLTDRLITALRTHQAKAITHQRTPFLTGHVFLNPHTMKRYSNITKPCHRLLERAKLPLIRIHDIRHLVTTYCVNSLEVPIEKVSHALGHTDIKTTQGYLNPKPENAKKVMDSLFDSLLTKGDIYTKSLDIDFAISESVKRVVNLSNESMKLQELH